MGVIEKVCLDLPFQEWTFGDLLLETLKIGIQLQNAFRVAAVQPASDDGQQQFQTIRVGRVDDLLAMKFNLVDGGCDQFGVDFILNQPFEHIQDNFFNGLGALFTDILESACKQGVPVFGVVTGYIAECAAQARIHQRLAQGRTGIAQQDLFQDRQDQDFEGIVDIAGQPGQTDLAFAGRVLAGRQGVSVACRSGFGPARLAGDIGLWIDGVEVSHDTVCDDRQVVFEGQVAVGVEIGVAGMVMALVKGDQLGMGQSRNRRRITARIVAVGCVGIHGVEQRAAHHLIGRRHGAFHFVVHHTFVYKAVAAGIRVRFELQAVTLLLETQPINGREKRGVQIDLHQVVVVLGVLGGEGIHGPVGGRKGVHEGAQAAFEHGEKGIADREFARPAQNRVLQNVGDAGGIGGHGFKGDTERVLLVGAADMDMPGPGGLVYQTVENRIDLIQRKYFLDQVAVKLAAKGYVAVEGVDGGGHVCSPEIVGCGLGGSCRGMRTVRLACRRRDFCA